MRSLVGTVLVAAACSAGWLAPLPAGAQGLYVGGAYSWASQSTDHSSFDAGVFEEDASGYKVFAGLEAGNFLGLEASYTNFGSYDALALEGFDQSPGAAESDGWGLALTGRMPVGSLLTLYGKAGYFFWDTSVAGTQDFLARWGDAAKSGKDPFYGFGLRVNLGRMSLFGEYEKYNQDQLDFDLVNAGIRFTF